MIAKISKTGRASFWVFEESLLHFLPRYSPELSAAECLNRHVKTSVLGTWATSPAPGACIIAQRATSTNGTSDTPQRDPYDTQEW